MAITKEEPKTLQEHLSSIAPKGWAGKVKKYGAKEARRRQGAYAKDFWAKKRGRKTPK